MPRLSFIDDFLGLPELASLSARDKDELGVKIEKEIAGRVGSRLSEGLTKSQLDEFHQISRNEHEAVVAWLEVHDPEFWNDRYFRKLDRQFGSDCDPRKLLLEYTKTKWLDITVPHYRTVVAEVVDQVRAETIEWVRQRGRTA